MFELTPYVRSCLDIWCQLLQMLCRCSLLGNLNSAGMRSCREKKNFGFNFFQKWSWPPPPTLFFGLLHGTFFKPDYIQQQQKMFLKVFGLGTSSKFLIEKFHSQSYKCSSSSLKSGRPLPSTKKNVQIQAKKFLRSFFLIR